MKQNKIFLILILSLAAVLLSACGAPPITGGFPSAVLNQETLYVAGGPAVLAMRSDGTQIWRYPAAVDVNKNFFAVPLVVNGEVVVGDYQVDQNTLFGLDASSGVEKWSFKGATGHFIAAPVALGDKILAANADGSLYALDKSGNLVWKFTAKGGLWGTPVVNKNVIYVTSLDHMLYALNPADGTPIWSSDLGGPIIAAPSLGENGTLYVGTMGSKLLAVEPEQGKILWTVETKGAVWSAPVLKNNILYFGDLGSKIYALNAKDGTPAWSADAPGPITAAPALVPEGLIFVCETGEVLAVGFQNERSWTDKVTVGKLYSSPVVAGERLVIPVQGGDPLLVTYDFSGRKGWTFAAVK
jgi:outer membrane protein assembly factor BamB